MLLAVLLILCSNIALLLNISIVRLVNSSWNYSLKGYVVWVLAPKDARITQIIGQRKWRKRLKREGMYFPMFMMNLKRLLRPMRQLVLRIFSFSIIAVSSSTAANLMTADQVMIYP